MKFGQRTLIVKVDSWHMSHTLFPGEQNETGRRITLTGSTESAHFLYPREAYIEIYESKSKVDYKSKLNEDGENYIEYGQINRFESDAENDVNEFVNGAIGVNMDLFDKVLFIIKELNSTKIILSLGLYGLDLGMASIEDDKWPENRLLSITDVNISATKHDIV